MVAVAQRNVAVIRASCFGLLLAGCSFSSCFAKPTIYRSIDLTIQRSTDLQIHWSNDPQIHPSNEPRSCRFTHVSNGLTQHCAPWRHRWLAQTAFATVTWRRRNPRRRFSCQFIVYNHHSLRRCEDKKEKKRTDGIALSMYVSVYHFSPKHFCVVLFRGDSLGNCLKFSNFCLKAIFTTQPRYIFWKWFIAFIVLLKITIFVRNPWA